MSLTIPTILLTLFAVSWLFLLLAVVGARTPGYSHVRHTISELGEAGAPHARLVAWGVFLPVGATMLVASWLAHSLGTEPFALAASITAGYLVAAIFPCDPGAPLAGTWRQAIHNLGGAVEYIGGGFALLGIAAYAGDPFRTLGIVVLCAAIAISLPPLAGVRGLVQRIAELCLFGGLALALVRA